MIQTYKFTSFHTNKNKLDTIKEIGRLYKVYYNIQVSDTIVNFYKNEGVIPRILPRLKIPGLSERYKLNGSRQVKANIDSWLSKTKIRVRDTVMKSYLPKEIKKELCVINKYNLWLKKEIAFKNGYSIHPNTLKLARKIFHHCRCRLPMLNNITMHLDKNVAVVTKSNNSFDYWIRLTSLQSYHPIDIPIKSYDYFESKKGSLKSLIQIIIKPDKIEYALIKDVEFEKKEYIKGKVIGVDTGCVIPLSSSTGNQYGLSLYGRLKKYDSRIADIVSQRKKNHYSKLNTPKLERLRDKVKNLIKNETGRITNEVIKKERPEEIVLEENKTVTKGFNCFHAQTRRIIKHSGITKLRDLLIEKGKKFGFKTIKINQAYTSQECPVCHHIDKRNRTKQKFFKCVKCGYKRNADYVGSVNIRNRRSITSVDTHTLPKRVRGLLEAHYKVKPWAVFQT
jgi:IS605 OrfB family transposase